MPTGASWLNLVERWFALLTEKQIKCGVHRSAQALEAAGLACREADGDAGVPTALADFPADVVLIDGTTAPGAGSMRSVISATM